MKRTLNPTLMAALAVLFSCSAIDDGQNAGGSDRSEVALNFSLSAASTKSVSTAPESAIERFSLYVFDGGAAGTLETSGSGTQTGTVALEDGQTADIQLSCKTGEKKVAALVNAPTSWSAGFSSYSSMLSTKIEFDPAQTSSLPMEGEISAEVTASTHLSINVKRSVARVELGSIVNSITSEQYAGKKLNIVSVYLINAVGDKPAMGGYSAAATDRRWLNFKSNAYSDSDADNLIYEKTSISLSGGESDSSPHYFYCMPNSVTADSDAADTADPRHTRLVVEACFEGETDHCYYPVTLPVLEANKQYVINRLTITQRGYDSPDRKDSQSLNMSFSIRILDWETAEPVSDYII